MAISNNTDCLLFMVLITALFASQCCFGALTTRPQLLYVDSKAPVNLDKVVAKGMGELDWPSVNYSLTVVANVSSSVHEVFIFNETKACHYHDTDAFATVVSGTYFFQIPTAKDPIILTEGDQFLTPKGQPHAEGAVAGTGPSVLYVTWSPLPSPTNTHMLDPSACLPP